MMVLIRWTPAKILETPVSKSAFNYTGVPNKVASQCVSLCSKNNGLQYLFEGVFTCITTGKLDTTPQSMYHTHKENVPSNKPLYTH